MMKELKESTRAGQRVIVMGSKYEGFYLTEVYIAPSFEKRKAWEWCYDEYMSTPESHSFGICSHNTFGFTVSWCGKKDGERIMRVETPKTSYLVWLDR